MDPLGRGGRWLRERRARRLLERARYGSPADLDAGTVDDLAALLSAGERETRRLAVEAADALARGTDPDPVRDGATDLLVETLGSEDEDLQAAAARSLRYVALQRPAVAARLDAPYAEIVSDTRHGAHREVAVDAGMVLSRVEGAGEALPETREALRETLVGGPEDARRAAAVAYTVAADATDAFEDPGTLAEHLAIVGGRTDGDLPERGTPARRLGEGRTVADAVRAFREAADREAVEDGRYEG